MSSKEFQQKSVILDLSKYLNQRVRVRLHGGREGEYDLFNFIFFIFLFFSDWNIKRT